MTVECRLILDTPFSNLAPGAGAGGALLADRSRVGAVRGLDELVADPELQHRVGDQDVAVRAGEVLPDADLLCADAGAPFRGDLPRDPLLPRSRLAIRALKLQTGSRLP